MLPQKLSQKAKLALALKGAKVSQKRINEFPLNNKKIPESTAKKLLLEIIGHSPTEMSITTIPLNSTQLERVLESKNQRLLFSILGTSPFQIQDSKLVDKDVCKFLDRDDVVRAQQLIKMARFQGEFATGTLVNWLIKKGRVNEAFDVVSNWKKRGYKLSGRLLNILISNYNDFVLKNDKSDLKVQKLLKLFQNEVKRGSVSSIHLNSMMKLLRKMKQPELALELFKYSESNNIKPDVLTYTELFRSITNIKVENNLEIDPESTETTPIGTSFDDLIYQAERGFYILQHEPKLKNKVDEFVVLAYLKVFVYSDSPQLRARAITIMREWWRLCPIADIAEHIPYDEINIEGPKKITNARLIQWGEINYNKKMRFTPDDKVLALYQDLCRQFNVEFTYAPNSKDKS
ncbi:hypothetical protein DAMA08_047510 [Martiniozyma asiatica (nom. inval.)]|nr:hypothetical protein DAMA08_047510 [Martiniozyma asiatica]